jgi:mRNA interferase MazF
MASPKRGEVWLVDLGYLAKIRPCLVLSVEPHTQDRSLVTLVIHTTSTRGSRFEVATNVRFLQTGAFDAQNLVTISLAKMQRRLGTMPSDQLAEVEAAVRSWLGI